MKAIAALAVAVMLALAPAQAASTPRRATLSGVVLNATCPGPCRKPSHPPRYTGPGLAVRVRSVRADEVVATRHPSDGRFAIDLRLGAYRVSADVTGACWRGSRRDITLGRDGKHIRLTVDNVCIA